MPYRERHPSGGAPQVVTPALRPGSDPSGGVRRALLPEETSLEAPWVCLGYGSQLLSRDDVERDFGGVASAFAAAEENVGTTTVNHRVLGEVHVYEGEFAAEMLTSATLRERLHSDLGARKLYVVIPERGVLVAVAQDRGQGPIGEVLRDLRLTHAEPITRWVLRVEGGALRGRAPKVSAELASAPPKKAAPALRLPEPDPALEIEWRPPRPAALPRSMGGKLALIVLCLFALVGVGMLRGLAARDVRQERALAAASAAMRSDVFGDLEERTASSTSRHESSAKPSERSLRSGPSTAASPKSRQKACQ